MTEPNSTPTPQQLVETALGWPLYHSPREVEDLVHLEGQRALIAVSALEKVIDYRTKHEEALRERHGIDPTDEMRAQWLPDAAGTVILNQELRRERRSLQMLQGIEAYREAVAQGKKTTELRDKQLIVTDRFHDFVLSGSSKGKSLIGLEKACSFISPTGSGKTAVFVSAAEMVKYAEDPEDPIRVLVIEPDLGLSDQVIRQGFRDFGPPDLDIGQLNGKHKQGDREVVVITDESFNIHVENGTLGDFDFVIGDEADILLTEKTLGNLRKYARNRLCMLTTATADKNEVDSVRFIAPPIYEERLRDALEDENSWLAPIQCLAVRAISDEDVADQVREQHRGESLTPDQLDRLIEREASMRTSLQFAKMMVENGIQAIMKCSAGDDLAEAIDAANRLNNIDIVDPRTGEERKISAIAVGGHQSPEERNNIYEAYDNGDYDVLTFVKVLGRGWNRPRCKGLIDNDPGTGERDAEQELGRITRHYLDENGELVVGLAVTVVDATAPPGFVTYGQVIGETTNDPNKIIGTARAEQKSAIKKVSGIGAETPSPVNMPKRRHAKGSLTPEQAGIKKRRPRVMTLPKELQRLIKDVEYVTFEEIAAGVLRDKRLKHAVARERDPQETIPLSEAARILRLSSTDTLLAQLESHGIELASQEETEEGNDSGAFTTSIFDNGLLHGETEAGENREPVIRRGQLGELVALSSHYNFEDRPTNGYFATSIVAAELRIRPDELDTVLNQRKVPVHTFIYSGMPDRYVSAEEFAKLKAHSTRVRRLYGSAIVAKEAFHELIPDNEF